MMDKACTPCMVLQAFLFLIGAKMGTNFYLHSKPCECCGRADEPLHIGKSSAGWAFALHVYPENEIKNLDDWKKILRETDGQIFDEYERERTYDEMIDNITNRSHPNGLRHSHIDGWHCIGNGEGTYDYIIGEFS